MDVQFQNVKTQIGFFRSSPLEIGEIRKKIIEPLSGILVPIAKEKIKKELDHSFLNGKSFFFRVAEKGNDKDILALLKFGLDPNVQNESTKQTPIFGAIIARNNLTIRELVKASKKDDPNKVKIDMPDKNKHKPIYYLKRTKNLEMLKEFPGKISSGSTSHSHFNLVDGANKEDEKVRKYLLDRLKIETVAKVDSFHKK